MKIFTRIPVFFLLGLSPLLADAVRDEIFQNRANLGSNYRIYPEPTELETPPPQGYFAFYVSHYGRHGSRYHYSESDYGYLEKTLAKAAKKGKLTATGKSAFERFRKLNGSFANRAGDLTQKGAAQHRGIAKRLVERYPAIFTDSAYVEAFSSTSPRSLVSMSAFLQTLSAKRPNIRIRQESGKSLMPFIKPERDKSITQNAACDSANAKLYSRVNPWRQMKLLFGDSLYVAKNIDPYEFQTKLYEITSSLQGMDSVDFDFNDLWTDDELFYRWQAQNFWWYSILGNCPATGFKGPESARPLLQNILDEADRAIFADTSGSPQQIAATFRFGHDTGILPLASLIEIGVACARVENVDSLYTKWADFKIIPMAANIQFVFYRSNEKGAPVLMKVLHNEREEAMPVPCNGECPQAPYYRWADVRDYFKSLLRKGNP